MPQSDETKPSCCNCPVYGKECPGYRAVVPVVFCNESQKIEQLVQNKQNGTRKTEPKIDGTQLVVRTARALQASYDQVALLRFLLDSSWKHNGHCYFLDQLVHSVR